MDIGGNPNILPVQVDQSVRFSSIGGLKSHIRCLREMVLFPLMYPELFKKFNSRPAKGVLFHGPPGTGKTLLARALANECSLVGGRKVSFFMRKGADVMNRYYGESERNLRMVFQQANKMKPSIIFFDEVDALAPIRNTRDGQTYASVVATLLAEMDGLCDRGEVIVIGATNRPDAMDPAVRRAGRFDRELFFPPPETQARREILQIHTKNWQPPLTAAVLDEIAQLTTGYLGSDIKALCSEAVLKAVRRVYPQIYECEFKLLVDAKNVQITIEDIKAAMDEVLPSGHRSTPMSARSLPPHCIPLLKPQLDAAVKVLKRAFPGPGEKCSGSFLVSGESAETYLAPALLAHIEHCMVKELNVATLHSAHYSSPQQAVISIFGDCRRAEAPCVIFVPDLFTIWNTPESRQGATILHQMWKTRPFGDKSLLLATCPAYEQLPKELQQLFPFYKDCIYRVREPTAEEVRAFLEPIVTELPLLPPITYSKEPLPELPRAPLKPDENPEAIERRRRHEFENLQMMRVTLRCICRNLASDRRFQKFNVPVNLEVAKDYLDVIKQPMDLQTLLTKIEMQQCYCGKEFLDDIDLICANALQYSLDRHTTEKKHRQDVCSLHTEAYSMVSEEIEPELELECQIIARRRRECGNEENFEYNDHFYFANLCKIPTIMDNDKSSRRKGRKRRDRSSEKSDIDSKRPRDGPRLNLDPTRPPKLPPDPESSIFPELHKHDITTCDSPCDNPGSPVGPDITINKAELDMLLNNNIEHLRGIGIEALLELHSQLSRVVHAYSTISDRTYLPTELGSIISRYIQIGRM